MRRPALALLAGLWPMAALAHPHVFVEQRYTVVLGPEGLRALKVEWTFDELYSASLIADFLGKNKKTQPTPEQTAQIEREAFKAIGETGYFLVLKLDDKPTKPGAHQNFAVSLDGPKLSYRFTLPLSANGATRLQVNALDDEWFIDFYMAKQSPVGVEAAPGAPAPQADCGLASEQQKTVLGMVDTPVATCRWVAKP